MTEAKERLLLFGIAPKTVDLLLKNQKLCNNLLSFAEEGGVSVGSKIDSAVGNLLYTTSTKWPAQARMEHRPHLAKYIVDGRIKSAAMAEGALAYLKMIGVKELDFSTEQFETESGVGVEVTSEDVAAVVLEIINEMRPKLVEDRFRAAFMVLPQVKKRLRWADGKIVKDAVDKLVLEELGPITEADMAKRKVEGKKGKSKDKGKGKGKKEDEKKEKKEEKDGEAEAEVERVFQMPHENDINTVANLQSHLKRTGGAVRTRFPPEPNGYLHIGHAKAMYLDFNYAVKYNGVCLLRFDDTNPEKEKQEYIDSILDIVEWLGHKPTDVTYSSDYFDQLYEFALVLIKNGLAYVDESTKEQIADQRMNRTDSPWRGRSSEESMELFLRMKDGEFDEGRYTLRLKMDMKNDNPVMRDLIAYRIMKKSHPRTGDKWCIYPSYDYTHCIVDSIEDITHSLCTLEFVVRRDSYYWLLEALDIFKPIVWEFSRLNLTGTVMSKRKIQAMVNEGVVDGWDDPRLFTLSSLRRRGFTPAGINNFCKEIGVSRANQLIRFIKLEQVVREDLDVNSPRAFIVAEPLKVIILNYPEDKVEMVEAPKFPKDKNSAVRLMPFSRVVYIEKSDFMEEDKKGYFGLAPGKEVRLRYGHVVKCVNVVKDNEGEIKEIHAEYDPESTSKPKGNIHWVAEPAPGTAPAKAELHLLEPLFDVDIPESLGDDWIQKVNKESLGLVRNAFVEPVLNSVDSDSSSDGSDKKEAEYTRCQAERSGYFTVDKNRMRNEDGHIVLIRTLTLREAKSKVEIKKPMQKLSDIIVKLIARSYGDLATLVDSLPHSYNTDLQRKRALAQYFHQARWNYVRLLVLVKWIRANPNLDVVSGGIERITGRAGDLTNTADTLFAMAELIRNAAAPKYAVLEASTILTAGKLPLPQCLELREISPLDVSNHREMVHRMLRDAVIRCKVPDDVSILYIEKGRIVFGKRDVYEVELTVCNPATSDSKGKEVKDDLSVVEVETKTTKKTGAVAEGDGDDGNQDSDDSSAVCLQLVAVRIFLKPSSETKNSAIVVGRAEEMLRSRLVVSLATFPSEPFVKVHGISTKVCGAVVIEVLASECSMWGELVTITRRSPLKLLEIEYWGKNRCLFTSIDTGNDDDEAEVVEEVEPSNSNSTSFYGIRVTNIPSLSLTLDEEGESEGRKRRKIAVDRDGDGSSSFSFGDVFEHICRERVYSVVCKLKNELGCGRICSIGSDHALVVSSSSSAASISSAIAVAISIELFSGKVRCMYVNTNVDDSDDITPFPSLSPAVDDYLDRLEAALSQTLALDVDNVDFEGEGRQQELSNNIKTLLSEHSSRSLLIPYATSALKIGCFPRVVLLRKEDEDGGEDVLQQHVLEISNAPPLTFSLSSSSSSSSISIRISAADIVRMNVENVDINLFIAQQMSKAILDRKQPLTMAMKDSRIDVIDLIHLLNPEYNHATDPLHFQSFFDSFERSVNVVHIASGVVVLHFKFKDSSSRCKYKNWVFPGDRNECECVAEMSEMSMPHTKKIVWDEDEKVYSVYVYSYSSPTPVHTLIYDHVVELSGMSALCDHLYSTFKSSASDPQSHAQPYSSVVGATGTFSIGIDIESSESESDDDDVTAKYMKLMKTASMEDIGEDEKEKEKEKEKEREKRRRRKRRKMLKRRTVTNLGQALNSLKVATEATSITDFFAVEALCPWHVKLTWKMGDSGEGEGDDAHTVSLIIAYEKVTKKKSDNVYYYNLDFKSSISVLKSRTSTFDILKIMNCVWSQWVYKDYSKITRLLDIIWKLSVIGLEIFDGWEQKFGFIVVPSSYDSLSIRSNGGAVFDVHFDETDFIEFRWNGTSTKFLLLNDDASLESQLLPMIQVYWNGFVKSLKTPLTHHQASSSSSLFSDSNLKIVSMQSNIRAKTQGGMKPMESLIPKLKHSVVRAFLKRMSEFLRSIIFYHQSFLAFGNLSPDKSAMQFLRIDIVIPISSTSSTSKAADTEKDKDVRLQLMVETQSSKYPFVAKYIPTSISDAGNSKADFIGKAIAWFFNHKVSSSSSSPSSLPKYSYSIVRSFKALIDVPSSVLLSVCKMIDQCRKGVFDIPLMASPQGSSWLQLIGQANNGNGSAEADKGKTLHFFIDVNADSPKTLGFRYEFPSSEHEHGVLNCGKLQVDLEEAKTKVIGGSDSDSPTGDIGEGDDLSLYYGVMSML